MLLSQDHSDIGAVLDPMIDRLDQQGHGLITEILPLPCLLDHIHDMSLFGCLHPRAADLLRIRPELPLGGIIMR